MAETDDSSLDEVKPGSSTFKADSGISVPRVIRFAYANFQTCGKKWIATCKKCSKKIQDTIGVTTSFTKHLKRIHKETYERYLHEVHAPARGALQSSIDSFVSSDQGSTSYGSASSQQKLLLSSLVNDVIVNCGMPISVVDNPHFRSFLKKMDPKFTPPCRQTVTNSLLPRLKLSKQLKLQEILDSSSDVSLTADIWTDRRMHAFLGVTVHTFNRGTPVSYLLSFQSFKGSHTGVAIAEALESVITDNMLQGKIRGIVTDNASNMRKALSVLLEAPDTSNSAGNDELENTDVDDPTLWEDSPLDDVMAVFVNTANVAEHFPCFAHSLQLVVRDGLEALTVVRTLLVKCCKLANLVHQSAVFRGVFETHFGNGRSIPSANETRWNSTFIQLSSIAALDNPKLNEMLRNEKHDNLVLNNKEYGLLQELVNILVPFAEATDLTQGSKTVTISCVVPIILSLSKRLQFLSTAPRTFSGFIKTLLKSLRERFAGLFHLLEIDMGQLSRRANSASSRPDLHFSSNVFLMAAALDPQYAFHWIQDHPGSDEEKEALRHKIHGLLYQELAKVSARQTIDTVTEVTHQTALPADPAASTLLRTDKKFSLFGHYRKTDGGSENVNVSPTAQTQLTDYLHFINGPEINAAEFSLATVCESKRFNLLGGLLSRVLCIPATSAPVERIFSQSGIIMRPHRARLSDSVLETLMFVKCNKDI